MKDPFPSHRPDNRRMSLWHSLLLLFATFLFPVLAFAQAPNILIAPDPVNFGSIPKGGNSTQKATVINYNPHQLPSPPACSTPVPLPALAGSNAGASMTKGNWEMVRPLATNIHRLTWLPSVMRLQSRSPISFLRPAQLRVVSNVGVWMTRGNWGMVRPLATNMHLRMWWVSPMRLLSVPRFTILVPSPVAVASNVGGWMTKGNWAMALPLDTNIHPPMSLASRMLLTLLPPKTTLVPLPVAAASNAGVWMTTDNWAMVQPLATNIPPPMSLASPMPSPSVPVTTIVALSPVAVVSNAGGWMTRVNWAMGATTAYQYSPVDVPGITDAVDITASQYHTCVVTRSGATKCWGLDDSRAIG